MKTKQFSVRLWMIIVLAGLTRLSENVYVVSLPAVQLYMKTTPRVMEWSLTFYLLAFAFGSLFWGITSDKYGRKICLMSGIAIYIVGCLICFESKSIEIFMIGRIVQAFGAAVGLVISQSIMRDSFSGRELVKSLSIISIALAIFPAVGPLIGSLIIKYYEWPMIFGFLFITGILLFLLMLFGLPETHPKEMRVKRMTIIPVAKRMLKDWNVVTTFVLISLTSGVTFSYYAEAPFYIQNVLGIPASRYGITVTLIVLGVFIGGLISKRLSKKFDPKIVVKKCTVINLVLATTFLVGVLLLKASEADNHLSLFVLLACMMSIACVQCIIVAQVLSIAFVNYKDAYGTAVSLLNFANYILISLCVFIMGLLHNGSLTVMPSYFFVLILIMFLVLRFYKEKNASTI